MLTNLILIVCETRNITLQLSEVLELVLVLADELDLRRRHFFLRILLHNTVTHASIDHP